MLLTYFAHYSNLSFSVNAVCHIVKNYLAHILNTKVPLILGIYQLQMNVL